MNDNGGLRDPFVSNINPSHVTSLTRPSETEVPVDDTSSAKSIQQELLKIEEKSRKQKPPSKSESCYYEMDETNMIYTKQGKATIRKAKRSRKQREDVGERENKLRTWVKQLLTVVSNQETRLTISNYQILQLENRISGLEREKWKMEIDISMLGGGKVMDLQFSEKGDIRHLNLKTFS